MWHWKFHQTQDWTKKITCLTCCVGSEDANGDPTTPCTDCAVGWFSSDASAVTPCILCTSGSFTNKLDERGGTACTSCGVGLFDGDGAAFTPCTTCLSGSFTDATEGAVVCSTCDSGKQAALATTNTGCTTCGAGRVDSDFSPLSLCEVCDGDSEVGGTFNVCSLCNPGREQTGGNSECTFCPAGKFDVDASSATLCLMCPAGQYANAAGQLGCIDCSAGTYVDATGSGEATDCINCVAGRYITTSGSDSASDCINCVAGKYSASAGSALLADCLDCPNTVTQFDTRSLVGSAACIMCAEGYGRRSATELGCVLCDALTGWNNSVSEESCIAHASCPPGKGFYFGTNDVVGVCKDCVLSVTNAEEALGFSTETNYRPCQPVTRCDPNTQYQAQIATDQADADCQDLATCSAGQWYT